MAHLTAFLRDLSTCEGRIAGATALMDHVYGSYDPIKHIGANAWHPRTLSDNKSRYLWTDAFGVVNYISLAVETGKSHYLQQAAALIYAVHNTLGRERPGGRHCQWLGGASEAHPCAGGLRIGKIEPEGHSDGDGQYYHYLTKWAFALNRMSIATGEAHYNEWAAELLKAVHKFFVYDPHIQTHAKRMYWKLSIDLKRPLVPSEGNLDPFDGLVSIKLVGRTKTSDVLAAEENDFQVMVSSKFEHYHSTDPLDLGEALWLSHWELPTESDWALEVSKRSARALEQLWSQGYFNEPPGFRLAFRELGTTLGAQVNELMSSKWERRVEELHRFWAPRILDRDSDISPVMLAASLVPGAWDRRYEEKLYNLQLQSKDVHKNE